MGNLVPLTQTPPPWIICYHAKLSARIVNTSDPSRMMYFALFIA